MEATQQTQQNENIAWDELYVKAYTRADRFYRQLVAVICVACAIGIGIAVMLDVIVGACIAICAAMLYSYFSSDDIYKRLGLRFTHVRGRIHITRAVAKYGDTLVIPSRLVFADVTAIDDGAFVSPKNEELVRVFIPKSIAHIGQDAFGEHTSHVEILFEGSAEEWGRVDGAQQLSAMPIAFDFTAPTLPEKKKKKKKSKKSRKTAKTSVSQDSECADKEAE
jgi:hypothetical protein